MQYRMIACVFVKVGADWYSTPGLEPGWNPDIINQKEEILLQLAPQVAQESIEPLLDLAPHVKSGKIILEVDKDKWLHLVYGSGQVQKKFSPIHQWEV